MYTFPIVSLRYSKTASIGIIILILCLIPSAEFSKLGVQITFADVIVHFVMFFVFAAALYLDIIKNRGKQFNKLSTMVIALGISISLGIFTELLQYIITPLNRSGSLIDLLFDLIGSAAGIGCIALIKRRSAPAS
jgi:VanZ family protein